MHAPSFGFLSLLSELGILNTFKLHIFVSDPNSLSLIVVLAHEQLLFYGRGLHPFRVKQLLNLSKY